MDAQYLSGQLLIAMPGMADPRFARSVVLICEHDENGALGFIVNHPAERLAFSDVLDQMEIELEEDAPAVMMHVGGPVDRFRGFVLHGPDYGRDEMTVEVSDAFRMTATREILEDIAVGQGPGELLIAIGYAGWGGGQLEAELQRNDWLTCPASAEIVFQTPDAEKWEKAVAEIGIDIRLLSSGGGSA
ncbi:YqgE/AlgH family protein [Paracoccaceae bacterium GXU_MW_L88]